MKYTPTDEDLKTLLSRYEGRNPYYGDIHCHPLAGVTGDGKMTLAEWKKMIPEKGLDFVTFLNHHQVYHMYEDEWDNSIFIGGTEPAAKITDNPAEKPRIHYNMILPGPEALLEILRDFPEFEYNGGTEGIEINKGIFGYPAFETARMLELINKVKELGGLWVHPHPKQTMISENPLDYWFADYTGLEVFYYHPKLVPIFPENYKLWTDLLALGKRIWATAGSDSHQDAKNSCLNVVYSEKKLNVSHLSHLAKGDFVCGDVGIRMVLGDANMGGHTDFTGKRLIFSVGDLHPMKKGEDDRYVLRLITDHGIVFEQPIDLNEMNYFALDADESVAYYRIEIHNLNLEPNPIIAIGNPIWNDYNNSVDKK